MTTAPIRKITRELFGLGLYRAVAQFALMVCALRAFPDHQWVVILAIIVFSLALGGMVEYQRLLFAATGLVDDSAERKTRHTIVLAQERALRGESAGGEDFWWEVDRRVSAETGEDDPAPSWRKAAGLVALNFAGRLFGDLVMVIVALAFTGSQ